MFIFIDSLEECEVQTNLKVWREPNLINIEFKEDSISYMEKLWLKKYRRYFLNFCIINKYKSYLYFLLFDAFCVAILCVVPVCINNLKAILNLHEAYSVLMKILVPCMYVMHN